MKEPKDQRRMPRKFKKRMNTEVKRFRHANMLDISDAHCWADLASFGMGTDMANNITNKCGEACKIESATHQSETCWCTKFHLGKRYKPDPNEESKALPTDRPF